MLPAIPIGLYSDLQSNLSYDQWIDVLINAKVC